MARLVNKNKFSSANIRSGFTLLEALISMAIGSAVLMLILGTITNGLRTQNQAFAVAELQKTSAGILSDLTTNLRWAKNIVVSVPSGTIDLEITNPDDSASVINYTYATPNLTKTVDGFSTNLNSGVVEITQFIMEPLPSAVEPTRINFIIHLHNTNYPSLPEVVNTHTISIRSAVGL